MSRVQLPAVLAFVAAFSGVPATAWDLAWIDRIGLPATDTATAPAADATGVYVLGTVSGALPGQTALGSRDVYLRKYSFAGEVLWTRQFGTPGFDFGHGVAAHGGSVYVSGRTDGVLPGHTSVGAGDVFVGRFTADGEVVWLTQLGTDSFETTYGVAVSDAGVFLAGETYGTFPGQPAGSGVEPYLARLDHDGSLEWVRPLGIRSPGQAPFTGPGGVAVDDTGVYLVANVIGTMPFRKYDFAGNPVWARDIPDVGECFFFSFMVSAHGGRVSLIGQVDPAFFQDMSVCSDSGVTVGGLRTYSANGDLLWQRAVEAQPGKGETPFTGGKVVHASASGVYVAANTTATFAGHAATRPRPDYSTCAGLGDPFFDALDGYVRRYDNDGNVVWTRQFGGDVFDIVTGLFAGSDSVYAAGDTSCSLGGQPYAGGFRDGFVLGLAIEPRDPAGLTHRVLGRLDTLGDARRLTAHARAELVKPLERALRAIEKQHGHQARAQLETFLRTVGRYRARAILDGPEADDLTEAAEAVIAAL